MLLGGLQPNKTEGSKILINLKLNKNFTTAFNKMCDKYGEEFEKINGFSEDNFNLSSFIDNFIDSQNTADSTIDPNANVQSKDICNLINEIPKPFLKLLGFNKLFYEVQKKHGFNVAKEVLEASWRGDVFIHNASDISFRSYCFNYDLRDLATKGMYFIENVKTKPAKHLSTFCDHVLETISYTSTRTSGGCGLANVLMWFFWFWKNDIENHHYVRSPEYYRDQCFQKFIFDCSMPYLRLTQCAYTTMTIFDRTYCEEMFGGFEYPDGKFFIDYIEEFINFQKAFMNKLEEMRKDNIHTFPVITYSLVYRDGKFVDEEFARWASKRNMDYADANFMISKDTGVMASCCRLLNDSSQRKGFLNSIGGGDVGIGSTVVTTLNTAAYAYQSTSTKDFFDILIKNTHLAIKINDIVRHIIKRNVEKKLLPNYTHGLIKLEQQLCTIGINGVAEAAKHFGLYKQDEFGYWNYTDEGLAFAAQILDKISAIKDSYNFDYSINVEQTPMENGAVKIARMNHLLYGSEEYITANQWIALKDKATVQARARASGLLDAKCGGGAIMHCQIDAPFNNEETAWETLNYIAKQGVIYFAFNLKINVDKKRHSFTTKRCPICGAAPEETYQRVVGYLVPTSSWSKERQQELGERDWMNLNDIIL